MAIWRARSNGLQPLEGDKKLEVGRKREEEEGGDLSPSLSRLCVVDLMLRHDLEIDTSSPKRKRGKGKRPGSINLDVEVEIPGSKVIQWAEKHEGTRPETWRRKRRKRRRSRRRKRRRRSGGQGRGCRAGQPGDLARP